MATTARIGDYKVGGGDRPLLIAGPCVIESEDLVLRVADAIKRLEEAARFNVVFKASYLKDNRSSGDSFRGPGLDDGLAILDKVKSEVGLPVLSDVHGAAEVPAAAEVLDIVQVPAFLCRQTSLIEAVAEAGKPVNVKKGQFVAPEDMGNVVDKLRAGGSTDILLTERGTSFGYHNLVVDFRGFSRMHAAGAPVIFDVTHSLQRPGGLGKSSGGEPELALDMARAAAAAGCDGFFLEAHPEPSQALSDAASMLPLAKLGNVLDQIERVYTLTQELIER